MTQTQTKLAVTRQPKCEWVLDETRTYRICLRTLEPSAALDADGQLRQIPTGTLLWPSKSCGNDYRLQGRRVIRPRVLGDTADIAYLA